MGGGRPGQFGQQIPEVIPREFPLERFSDFFIASLERQKPILDFAKRLKVIWSEDLPLNDRTLRDSCFLKFDR